MNAKEAELKMKQILSARNASLSDLGTSYKDDTLNRYKEIFDYVFKSLYGEFQNILSKTFIVCEFKYWWVEFYSKSSFYRLREKALTSFVSLFEMMYENI